MKTGPFGAFWRKARKFWTFRSIILFICSLYISTFLVVLPFKYRELGYSSFFVADRLKEKINLQNRERLENSLKFLGEHAKTDWPNAGQKGKKGGLKVCVSILTKRRLNSPEYLIQTFAKLVKETTNMTAQFDFNVVNAEYPPEENKEAERLKQFDIGRHHIAHTEDKMAYLQELDSFDKHRVDLVEALNICNNREYQYALLLEDDAFAGDNFHFTFDYLFQSLHQDTSLGYVKLYHPEKWQGFGYDTKLELCCILVVTVALSSSILIPIAKKRNFSMREIFQGLILLLLISTYVLMLGYTFSRQHILETFKFSKFTHFLANAPGCCISAVLYPTRVLDELLSFLRTELVCTQSNPIDVALANYFESKGRRRLLVVPNLFYHIGYYSSIGGAKDPKEFFFLYPPRF